MPLAAIAYLVGAPAVSGDTMATLTGTVTNGTPLATLVGTVSGGRVAAYEAPCIRTGYKVKLNNEWVPEDELVDLTLRESEATPVSFLDLSVIGARYAILTSLQAWTLVPLELWMVNGVPGAEIEELRFSGYVRPGGANEANGPSGAGVALGFGAISHIGRAGEYELCHEIEPLSGLTRGEIATELCADAGLTAVDFPDGAVYTKGIEAKGVKLLAYLMPFCEPEGWKLRERPRTFAAGGPILEAWTPALKLSPLPPDAIWDCTRSPSFKIESPRDVPSRFVVRGYGAVFVDEVGQSTRIDSIEVEALYGPKVATHQQDSSGTVTATGFPPNEASLRVVQKLKTTTVSRGDKPLSQRIEEEGWYNPRHAYKRTAGSAYVSLPTYIDEAGEYVLLYAEQFMTKSRRITHFRYDATGLPTGSTTQDYVFHALPQAIATVGGAEISISDSSVYGDGNSYSTEYEFFGLQAEHVEERRYDAATGAEAEVTTTSSGFVPVRSLVSDTDGNAYPSYYVRADGMGQTEITATWHTYAKNAKRNLFSAGSVVGTVEETSRLDTYRMIPGYGAYQWGDFDSNYTQARLLLADVATVGFTVLSSDSYERVTLRPGEAPVREVISGRVPQPRYMSSPWTYLRMNPIELVVDDPVVEALLGFRREVLNNDHIQDLIEAARVIKNRRAEKAAYRITLTRNETMQRVGDTVLLLHPGHACAHRGRIVDVTTKRSRVAPSQIADYTLSVPW